MDWAMNLLARSKAILLWTTTITLVLSSSPLWAQQGAQLPQFNSFGNNNFGGNGLPAAPPVVRPEEDPIRIAARPSTDASNPSNAAPGLPQGEVSPDAASDSKEAIPMRSLLQIFHDGGILMYPIAICSFVLFAFSLERVFYLRRGRVIPKPFVRRVMEVLEQQQIDREEALALCEENGSPVANLFNSAIKKWGRPSVEVEQAVLDTGERIGNSFRRNLRVMNAVSNVSPLLGLLGTVLGMIEAFNAIASSDAMGRPELLASGISTALITTAAGLVVAIPAYLAYMFFLGRVDRLIIEMDELSQQVIDYVSAEGLQEASKSRRSRSKAA
ncbi:MAG: Biopolymer transport protein ExbB [Planctomycetota bacterium]